MLVKLATHLAYSNGASVRTEMLYGPVVLVGFSIEEGRELLVILLRHDGGLLLLLGLGLAGLRLPLRLVVDQLDAKVSIVGVNRAHASERVLGLLVELNALLRGCHDLGVHECLERLAHDHSLVLLDLVTLLLRIHALPVGRLLLTRGLSFLANDVLALDQGELLRVLRDDLALLSSDRALELSELVFSNLIHFYYYNCQFLALSKFAFCQ